MNRHEFAFMPSKRRERKRIAAATLAGVCALGALTLLATLASAAGQPVTVGEVQRAALSFAAANGDASPASAEFVQGSRLAVLAKTMQPFEDTDRPVFAVQLEGHFVGRSATRPYGSPPPTGRYLLLLFDAETVDILDWSLGPRRANLSLVGAVQPLPTRP